ncbi:MAG: hypothetical protein FI719_08010 [SAR202 cluster bacterium]|nr:hypothetical protein [SAR202 cluster bacterium]
MKNPVEIATNLVIRYGHRLGKPIIYTQGVALSGRIRVEKALGSTDNTSKNIDRMVSPYLIQPSSIFGVDDGTANYAGLCWADELAEATGNKRYLQLIELAAQRFGPTVNEGPLDPDLRVEDIFFASTVLGRAFRSTGKLKYVTLLTEFLESFTTLQSNNLWWHCKTSPYFWGRGNAFAALGFAEAMTYIPVNHPSRPKLMQTHLRHLAGLTTHQDASGMWRQVINRPDTYLEHSATCMIGYSIARGIRNHWLSDAWRPTVERAWDAVSQRIGEDGSIKQVCVGTGPLASLEEYIKRPYTDGVDERGGAMALWFAAEMVRMQSEN